MSCWFGMFGRCARKLQPLVKEPEAEDFAMKGEVHQERLARARQSLEGLSCGDAFGERFFLPEEVALPLIRRRALPAPPWP